MSEMELLNSVRLKLQEYGCKTFRVNVGKVKMQDGRWFETGLPKGFSDVLVVRGDGKTCFVETKLHPRKPTKEQARFMLAMIKHGCPSGVAYTVEEAVEIIGWSDDFAKRMTEKLERYL